MSTLLKTVKDNPKSYIGLTLRMIVLHLHRFPHVIQILILGRRLERSRINFHSNKYEVCLNLRVALPTPCFGIVNQISRFLLLQLNELPNVISFLEAKRT